ncbi:MAG TPA: hypothetical protein VFP72_01385 [Kineosporiaceae bacterium]|nr:hypothetical protein [Kineosporiaceae bacterium]
MIAPPRLTAASHAPVHVPDRAHDRAVELWRDAVKIRSEWLDHGVSTQPADRPSSEHHLSALYARTGRPTPAFVWVDSPAAALPLIGGLPTLGRLYGWVRDPHPPTPTPLASDLATLSSQLRAALSAGAVHTDPELSPMRRTKRGDPWPERPPLDALRDGTPLALVLHRGVRVALHRSLAHRLAHRVRDRLGTREDPAPVCWYGQQDAAWIAYYDMLCRVGLARYDPDAATHFQHWAALARSCGWWWPGERVCVVVERPATLYTRSVPHTWYDEVGPAPHGITYRDGWNPALT